MNRSKAYSYTRYSSPEQAKGDSYRRQIEAAREYASKLSLELDESLIDKGLSAFHGVHRLKGALGSFLNQVEKGHISKGSYLIVESLDRLSREEVLDALTSFLNLINAGIKVVTLQDQMEYTRESINRNFGELLMSIVIMSRAHEESSIKSRRISESWKKKRERLDEGGILTRRCPAWLTYSDSKKTFVPISDAVKIIRQMFQMKLHGTGSDKIARLLNQQHRDKGTWAPRNGFHKSYVNRILMNPGVIGEFQPYKFIDGIRKPIGDVIEGYYGKPVIDPVIFHRVQAIFQKNREAGADHAGGRNGAVSNVFGKKLAVCGWCGEPMRYINKGPTSKGGQYLICDRAWRKLGCHPIPVRYEEIEDLILSRCRELNVNDILPGNEKRMTELQDLQNQAQAVEQEIARLKQQYENVFDSFQNTNNNLIRADLEKRLAANLAKQQNLQNIFKEACGKNSRFG